jgi:hypothetical protein
MKNLPTVTDYCSLDLGPLLHDPGLAGGLSRDEARAMLVKVSVLQGRFTAVEKALTARLLEPDETVEVNLSAKEAARRLGVSNKWLYQNAEHLPFAARVGGRVVLSARGLAQWHRQRMGKSP